MVRQCGFADAGINFPSKLLGIYCVLPIFGTQCDGMIYIETLDLILLNYHRHMCHDAVMCITIMVPNVDSSYRTNYVIWKSVNGLGGYQIN